MHFEVKKESLSLKEFRDFVSDVADHCFDPDGTYSPTLKHPLIKQAFASYFLGFPKSEDLDRDYSSLCSIRFSDFKDRLCFPQLLDLFQAIDDTIEARRSLFLHRNDPVTNLVTSLLKTSLDTISLQKEAVKQSLELNSQFSIEDTKNMMKAIQNFSDGFNNPEFVAALANAVQQCVSASH